jgi:pimeloyl-ACP methyl ester carboxylesterase
VKILYPYINLPLEVTTMNTKFVTSHDGIRIAYDIAGRGPALILLHGAGKTRRDWHKLGYVDQLQSIFTVITVDIRGTGESDYLVEEEAYAIDKICQDLYAVADDCGVAQFAIWGFSFGGNIGRYPAAWSDRVTAIAVVGVPFGPAVDEAFDVYIQGLEKKYGHLAEAQKKETNLPKNRSPIKGQMAGWLACFRAMRGWPCVDPGDLRCPAMLVVGAKNKNVMRWVETQREELDQAGVELQIIDGLTHNQEFTEIDRVFSVIQPFFKKSLSHS